MICDRLPDSRQGNREAEHSLAGRQHQRNNGTDNRPMDSQSNNQQNNETDHTHTDRQVGNQAEKEVNDDRQTDMVTKLTDSTHSGPSFTPRPSDPNRGKLSAREGKEKSSVGLADDNGKGESECELDDETLVFPLPPSSSRDFRACANTSDKSPLLYSESVKRTPEVGKGGAKGNSPVMSHGRHSDGRGSRACTTKQTGLRSYLGQQKGKSESGSVNGNKGGSERYMRSSVNRKP